MPTTLTDIFLILAACVIPYLAWRLYSCRRSIQTLETVYEEAEYQVRRLGILTQFENAISGELELDFLCDKIVEKLDEFSGYPYVCLYFPDDHTLKLHCAVGIDKPIEQLPIDQGVSSRVIRSGETEHVTDMDQDPLFSRTEEQVGSSVWIPLSDPNQVIGTLVVGASSETAFSETDIQLMKTIGEHLKSHIARAQLHMEISGRGRQYQSVIDNVDEVIFQTDAFGYWAFLNPAWTVYTGEPIEDSLGNSILEYVYPDDQWEYLNAFAPLMSGTTETCRCVFRIVHEEDHLLWVEMHAHPVHNEEGAIIGAFGTLIDITERKQQEAERADEQDETVSAPVSDNMRQRSEGGKVLMMDDERIVRSLVSDILTHAGYEVVLTEDGEEAVQAYKDAMSSGAPFDSVIMDLTVPGGMGGKDAHNRIMMADPNALVIVSSGYVNNPILANYRKYGFIGMVPKPYQADHLTRVLDEVITTGQARD